MVKVCWLPGNRGVARLAGLGEAAGDVVRIGGALKVFQVAGYASGGRQVVIIVDMAVQAHARRIGVRVGQRKSGGRMVELSVQPIVCIMTLLATRWETCGYVVGVRGGLELRCVTGITLCGKPLKLSRCCALMTRLAIDSCVRADQWKAILVIPNRRHRNPPALDRVTRFAIGAELRAVNIRMTVCAFLTHIRKHQFDVALHASHFFMHAAQRVARLVVVKFRDAADGLPAQRRMAVFARNGKGGPVRIAGNRLLGRSARPLRMKLQSKQDNNQP